MWISVETFWIKWPNNQPKKKLKKKKSQELVFLLHSVSLCTSNMQQTKIQLCFMDEWQIRLGVLFVGEKNPKEKNPAYLAA